ncbi:MAG: hypothetical protein IPN38_17195 [Flavobacteriales bacterium]|nr:hypothetical protein [Flavobacteriales bacterium]
MHAEMVECDAWVRTEERPLEIDALIDPCERGLRRQVDPIEIGAAQPRLQLLAIHVEQALAGHDMVFHRADGDATAVLQFHIITKASVKSCPQGDRLIAWSTVAAEPCAIASLPTR